VMEAVPALVLADGVKMALRVRPKPVMAERVPPVTERSPVVPSQEKELPGSSEKVKVMVAVSVALRVDWEAEIASVGAMVSGAAAVLKLSMVGLLTPA